MEPTRMYEYLTLARSRVFAWLRPLDDAAYRAEHPIGLGSIARTLHHMRAAEASYMHRVNGATSPLPPSTPEDDPEVRTQNAMGFAALEVSWNALARRTASDLARVTDWSTPRVCVTTWEGEPFRYRASGADFFSQLVLHETHHRAQVLHMLKRSGVETEEIDYNALMWEAVE